MTQLVQSKEHSEWLDMVEKWKRAYPLKYCNKGLKPQFVIEEIDRLTHGDAIIATEVGQHQMWAAQFYKFNNLRSFISSGGLGSMGFGLLGTGASWADLTKQLLISPNGAGNEP